MKKLCAIFLMLALLAALAACGGRAAPAVTSSPAPTAAPASTEAPVQTAAPTETPAPTEAPEVVDYIDPEAFVGSWVYSRARLEIARMDGEGYRCAVTWGSSAWEFTRWVYDCFCDGEGLYSFETGTKTNYTFAEDGSIKESEVVFSDGATRFDFNEDGTVHWTDFKEPPGAGEYDFERLDQAQFSPTPQQIADEYFRVVGSFHSGTAGGSLAKAVAAVEALRFVYSHSLWAEPVPALRDNMLEAWKSLSDEERFAFDENSLPVVELVKDCVADWETNRGRVEDAGVEADMAWLLLDPITLLGWDMLTANTLTLGNSEG